MASSVEVSDTMLRNPQACERCRSQKLACRPSSDPLATACERCSRSGRACIPHVRKPYAERRAAKKQESIASVSLSFRPYEESSTMPSRSPSDGPHDTTTRQLPSSSTRSDAAVPIQTHASPASAASAPPPPFVKQSKLTPAVEEVSNNASSSLPDNPDVLTCGETLLRQLNIQLDHTMALLSELTWQMAEHALSKYRNMTRVWPFVSLKDSTDPSKLVRDKPMVMTAILVVSHAQNIPWQDTFALVFRQALARKVVIEGEQSLDLLQSMLIYMAWYHTSYRHESAQMYQLLNMLVGMLPDLNLHQRYLTGSLLSGTIQDRSNILSSRDIDKQEAYRALIGAYYLSCGYNIFVFDRALLLPHSTYLVTCAESLNDIHALDVLKVFHCIEKTRTLLASANTSTLDVLHESVVREVKELQARSENVPEWLRSTYFYAVVYAYECRNIIESPTLPAANRLTNLTLTAQAALAYMAFFEEHRVAYVHELGSVEWLQLFACLSILSRVIVELLQAHSQSTAPESLVRLTSKTIHYIDVIERNYSNPYHAERRSACSVWFCAISSTMKQRILAAQDPSIRNHKVQSHAVGTTMETLNELTREAIPNGGYAAAEAGKYKGMDLHAPQDTYMDVTFEAGNSAAVFPFLDWMNSASSASDSEAGSSLG